MSLPEEASDDSHRTETELEEGEERDLQELSSKRVQTETRTISPLTLFKEDFNQLKEEMGRKFKVKVANPTTEKLVRPLSLSHLKEDLNQLKEDISSVFRINVSKDQEKKDERQQDNSKTSKTNEAFRNLFRGDRTPKAQDTKESFSGTKQNPNITENNVSKSRNRETNGPERRRCAETQQSWRTPAPQTAGGELETPNVGINLFTLTPRVQTAGDVWSPKNFATYLTLDPNTAYPELRLAEGNRKAIRDWMAPPPPEHPDRFVECPQVLCREGLLDSVYWEVVWTGGVDIGVTYNSISRYKDTTSCILGHNEQSWSLECAEGCYTPCHGNRRFKSVSPEPFSHRVGVYLNWPAGTLSFYCISQDAMVHLHTFSSTFSEPLYPGFWVWSLDGSVALCQVELEWERQLR
ncbi:E3 ubiquitin/ISG15 ligase TRIM25 [Nothobranchius furzeri]|uniref:Transcript variant X1 n=1 Tax=Nothobranchius furzeri TaxID=105023 RepID=A0A9D3BAR9_NOTFU|nr:E3 ubiquitin/ISG15 ligase TRIM25 [Nothobranchius furzeri]XP_015826759.1 E3 ubiquitin/ISG15 ligase TRIM25 [Nothobranchius furzeri]KAF7202927.1 transcript variant X2 [Nothobranchius furzeri]KAF7202928.1 transcript variant X1 [Nothobranchius furzeri]